MRRLPFLLLILFSCVGEDVVMDEVDPEIRITNPIENIEVGTTYQFEYMFLDNVGMEATPVEITWSTSDASKVIVNADGLASALDFGDVTLTLSTLYNNTQVATSIDLTVSDNSTSETPTERNGSVNTTTSYDLVGDFTMTMVDGELTITFEDNYVADDGLPGLYVYLTNNPNSPNGGYEIGPVQIFNGAHEYQISGVGLFDYDYIFYYCKPFKVKVGHGEIE